MVVVELAVTVLMMMVSIGQVIDEAVDTDVDV